MIMKLRHFNPQKKKITEVGFVQFEQVYLFYLNVHVYIVSNNYVDYIMLNEQLSRV